MNAALAICVLFATITCAVQTQQHVQVPVEADLKDNIPAGPVKDRVKRGIPSLLYNLIKSARYKGKSGIIFKTYSYFKHGGYGQARADFLRLTGQEIPENFNLRSRGKGSISAQLISRSGNNVTLYRERNAFIIEIKDKRKSWKFTYNE